MFGERPEIDWENEAVPVCAPRVVVATPVTRAESVLQAKPDWVASEPPVADIEPFKVAEEVETDEGAEVVRVGFDTGQAPVVNVWSLPYEVPCWFTAKALKWYVVAQESGERDSKKAPAEKEPLSEVVAP